ncbi:MAG: hypothetical protein GC154_20785 [bacterium]|nr:hypothetical protein [bacterium]
MNKPGVAFQSEENLSKAFAKFETLLSSQKARELIDHAESTFAFDSEVFLQPLRRYLSECLHLVGDLTRERGATGRELQRLIPVMTDYLEPGSQVSRDIAVLEKKISDKKRENPDFVMAFKLQILIRRYEESLKAVHPESDEYEKIKAKIDNARATLHNHMQTKVRLAQRALEPDMLELAMAQLSMIRHQERVLRIKQELLDACRNQCQRNLGAMAKIFQEADPELADIILSQMNAVKSTGALIRGDRDDSPKTLSEYKSALETKGKQIDELDYRLEECRNQLNKLQELEEAIFSTFGDQLREKGIKFQKKIRVEKSGSFTGIAKKQPAVRMARSEKH